MTYFHRYTSFVCCGTPGVSLHPFRPGQISLSCPLRQAFVFTPSYPLCRRDSREYPTPREEHGAYHVPYQINHGCRRSHLRPRTVCPFVSCVLSHENLIPCLLARVQPSFTRLALRSLRWFTSVLHSTSLL